MSNTSVVQQFKAHDDMLFSMHCLLTNIQIKIILNKRIRIATDTNTTERIVLDSIATAINMMLPIRGNA